MFLFLWPFGSMLSFSVQRITGMLLVFYLFLHLFVLSRAIISGASYNEITTAFKDPFFYSLEILLILGISFHLFNGIRIIIVDFLHLTKQQGAILIVVAIICAVIFTYTVFMYLPKFL